MLFHSIAALLATAALASYVNYRYLRLPTTIGLMMIALVLSLGLAVLARYDVLSLNAIVGPLQLVNFSDLLLHGMLAYLLFAGALHVDLNDLRSEAPAIALLATVSVIITAFVAATILWSLAQAFGLNVPFLYMLLFGALIAPTDPIAVLGIMKQVAAPKRLQMHVTGESLFNDGVGVVLFLTVAGLIASGKELSLNEAGIALATEVLGGGALGLVTGWFVYRLLCGVEAYAVEILLTLGLAGGVYAAAEILHLSAPIAVVVAGLVIGNHGRTYGMSDSTREHVDLFWELLDEVLNAVLFVLIGLEVLLLHVDRLGPSAALLAAAAIVVVLLARLIGVGIPMGLLRARAGFSRGSVLLLTWAGLRGGISIALALSLPESAYRDLIITVTYVVVIFSVLAQGLTLGPLLRRSRAAAPENTQP